MEARAKHRARASAEHGDGDSTDDGMRRVPGMVEGYGSGRGERDNAEHGGRYSAEHWRAPLKPAVVEPEQVPRHLTFGTVCVPFSPNDLVLRQQQTPRLRDDPEKVVKTIWGILRAYDPTWADVQQLFESVFAPDERIRIQSVIKDGLQKPLGEDCGRWPTQDGIIVRKQGGTP